MLHTIRELMEKAASSEKRTIAVAAAHDKEVLQAVFAARDQGVADAILTGDPERIAAFAKELGYEQTFEVIPAADDKECAAKAVALVREGRANCLMKGILSTADMMRAVIDKENGIRTGSLLSHVMIYEIPGYDKLLVNTDGGMNTAPNLDQKADILENAAKALKALGYDSINASCVCGAEVVNPKVQATVDAAALVEMKDRWATYNMNVIGPVGFDLAISKEACHHKKFDAPGAGEADIMLVPAYEVGNGIGKALTYFAGAKSAGIIIGARVPIVLVSRADNAETKLASIALGCLIGEMK